MSSTNRKRAARALAAQQNISYQAALAQVLTGQTPASPTVCDRCGGAWGEDPTCARCTTEDGEPRPVDQPGPLGPGAVPVCPVCQDNDEVRFKRVGDDDPRPWECGDCGTLFADGNPYAGLEIVWADEDGEFPLAGGSWGNPGCDGCGQQDAVACINGEYACLDEVRARGLVLPDGFHCFTCGNDSSYQFDDECRECADRCRTAGCTEPTDDGEGWNGFCGNCADRLFGLTCRECGEPMMIEEGTEVSHHVTSDGEIDYRADGNHVAVRDDEDFITGLNSGKCDMCNGDISDYAPGETRCVWCAGESED